MYKSRKAVRLKPLASRRRVAKARAAGGLPLRRKGAQPGNDNRLIHGRYSRALRARRMKVRTILRDARAVIAEITAAATSHLPQSLPLPHACGGEGRGEGASQIRRRKSEVRAVYEHSRLISDLSDF